MMTSPAATIATRATLLFSAKDIIGWAFPKANDLASIAAQKQWLNAVATLAAIDPLAPEALSTLERLWLVGPRLAFQQLNHPKAPVPADIRADVQAAATAADRAATSPYTRHAVISDAADLLTEAGDPDSARRLLTNEIAHTDTPWYYQAALADLELSLGHEQAALAASAEAKASARGNATRLQWIARDIQFTAKSKQLSSQILRQRLLADARDYYDVALTLPDGFSGRSSNRAEKVASLLSSKLTRAEARDLASRYAPRCGRLEGDAAARCHEHFRSLTGIQDSRVHTGT
jgi:protein disulfide-isomerase